MLILQRRVGQRIVVSGGIEITVTSVSKRGVRLAVSAPPGVTVLRGEVYDDVARANAQAADSEGAELDEDSTSLQGEHDARSRY
jgi:carbon storage regulator